MKKKTTIASIHPGTSGQPLDGPPTFQKYWTMEPYPKSPEGFVPFEFDTGMGILRLPDRKCVLCLSNGTYWACTRCTYKEILNEHLIWEANRMNKELIDYINKHPEDIS